MCCVFWHCQCLDFFFFPSSLGSLELDTQKITVLWFIYSPETQKQWGKVSETSCWWQCTIKRKKQKKEGKVTKKITVRFESSMWLPFIFKKFLKICVTKKAKDILKNTEEFPLIVVHMDTRSTQAEQDVQARRTVLNIQEKKISQSGYHHVAQFSGQWCERKGNKDIRCAWDRAQRSSGAPETIKCTYIQLLPSKLTSHFRRPFRRIRKTLKSNINLNT